jgi:F0F1-type ATP synthase membrane subunit b/b'
MKPTTKKLVERVASTLLDLAHEGAKSAVNEATRRIHRELERQKEKSKKKIGAWIKKK